MQTRFRLIPFRFRLQTHQFEFFCKIRIKIPSVQILKIFKKPRVREKRTAGKKRGCKQGKNKNQNFHSGNSTFNFGGSSFERSHIAADSSPGSGAGPVRLSGKSPKT